MCHLPMMFGFGGSVGEGSWTVVAFVGTVSGVRIHMAHQLLVLDKASSADPARNTLL